MSNEALLEFKLMRARALLQNSLDMLETAGVAEVVQKFIREFLHEEPLVTPASLSFSEKMAVQGGRVLSNELFGVSTLNVDTIKNALKQEGEAAGHTYESLCLARKWAYDMEEQ